MWLILAAFAALSRPALADSDGYYCVGPDYLAYQLSISADTGAHSLFVIPLDGAPSLPDPAVLGLDFFQVHGMRCTGDAVALLASDAAYLVDVSERGHPVLQERVPSPEGGLEDYVNTNLGAWAFAAADASRTQLLPLPSASEETSYTLRIRITVTPGEEGLVRHHMTDLVRRSLSDGSEVSKRLFDARSIETID